MNILEMQSRIGRQNSRKKSKRIVKSWTEKEKKKSREKRKGKEVVVEGKEREKEKKR